MHGAKVFWPALAWSILEFLTWGCELGGLPLTITQSGGTVTVKFNAPTAGTYVIAIKYNPQSLKNKPAPSPTTTVHYDFMTTGVPASTSGLDLLRQ